MILKEVGFRPVYHYVCAFELNDELRELIRECPDAAKASHAVMYGYIDPKDGLMLEVLCAGKQAPKYFYFRDTYQGKRVSIQASKVENVEFMFFPDLAPRFYKQVLPRIELLKEYEASEKLEDTRKMDFLDSLRSLQYPDDVKVVLRKDGLKPEEVWVSLTEPGEHELLGTLLNQPFQNYGVNKGDTIGFNVEETDEKKLLCIKSFDEPKVLTKESLADGNILKQCIQDFLKDTENEELFQTLLVILKNSQVVVPCDVEISEKASPIMDKIDNGLDFDSLSEEEKIILQNDTRFLPSIITSQKKLFMPAFSSEDEIGDHHKDAEARLHMPMSSAVGMAVDMINNVEGIVINPYTDNFILNKELFDVIQEMKPIFDDSQTEVSVENDQYFSNQMDLPLVIFADNMSAFNFALYENGVSPIQGMRIVNDTGDTYEGLSIRITSSYQFFEPYEQILPSIPSGKKPIDLPDPHLIIYGKELASLTESVNAEILIELRKDNETICGIRGKMQVLAYDQWMGSKTYSHLLPAFVLPNHPVIPALMHDASGILAKWNKPSSIEGYQMHDPNRVRDLAAAAFAAIQRKNIVYAEAPVSFSVAGQRIRTPETIMEQRLGTCMDMTLLYAALLEQMGLHPLLVLLEGHIFAGVWLKERKTEEIKSGDVIIDNIEQLTMRIDTGSDEMTFVECTAMCSGKNDSFEDAEKYAKSINLNPDEFRFAIDVFISRIVGVKPIASRVKNSDNVQIEVVEKSDDELSSAPADIGLTISEIDDIKPRKVANKRELWESKLLDLSSRNILLSLPTSASVEPIMSCHINELEDALADGHEFNILPAADWIVDLECTKVDSKGKESKSFKWLTEAVKEQGVYEISKWPAGNDFDYNEKIRQEYKNHRLYAFCNEKQLDRELTTIYRAARSSQQENGVSSLYLAIGLLRWVDDADNKKPCYAPLILVPIELERKSANQGYTLHARNEEPRFNTTLLEMLKQQYNLDIPGVEPLPADDHGINTKKVFSSVRSAIFNIKNWDVIETCVIANFRFAQFAMWNDIHSAGEALNDSKIVRSLMNGYVDWDVSESEQESDPKLLLPISVDATQLKAIQLATSGNTFVLHGPPGTGKSQTITAMIANLMANGKRVLFVAEKKAALEVVRDRLEKLGIGKYCLEIHSDKADKKHVLSQLEAVLNRGLVRYNMAFSSHEKETKASRAELDTYGNHLHQLHRCGYSLRTLIALYELVRDEEKYIKFDPEQVGLISYEDIQSHISFIEKLISAGKAVDYLDKEKLSSVKLLSFGADVRTQIRGVIRDYWASLSTLKKSGSESADILGVDQPKELPAYYALLKLIDLFDAKKETNPILTDILQENSDEIVKYLRRKEYFDSEEKGLLEIWHPEFLNMNATDYLIRIAAISKKVFGKTHAASELTSEIQSHAYVSISYPMLPEMLQAILVYQEHKEKLANDYSNLSDKAKNLVRDLPSEESYKQAYTMAQELEKQAESFPGGLAAITRIARNSDSRRVFDELEKSIKSIEDSKAEFNGLLNRTSDEDKPEWLENEIALCEYLSKNPSVLKEWGIYNKAKQDCINVGLEPVVHAFEEDIESTELIGAYKKGFYYALINHIIYEDDELSGFSGSSFNESIEQFKKMDDSLLVQTRSEIVRLISDRIPSDTSSVEIGKEISLLRKAISSNSRGVSLRELFSKIPHILYKLCPCFLMSPNSVAQYLPQDSTLFDVVIFDEASQLPTCKAVGSLLRAKDAVIVGDPKQMPPTSFFAGGGPEVEDFALADLDSILDDALALGIPSQHLQWHYRSQHESLISFSNSHFYNNRMHTFPSANDRARRVTLVRVDGNYKKGTNAKEAKAVVEEIIRRFRATELKGQSVGVVTFNSAQQELIENLLVKQYQQDLELEKWATEGENPLFVKNLENVQGDERDAIIFSICYGPDENGKVSNNFGPINKTGGEKRLNVAFSRSRMSMTIIASMDSSSIKVQEDSPEGVKAFQSFLKYAEGGELNASISNQTSGDYSKAGIMKRIQKEIIEHGFECKTIVGQSDFHVDIAVVDPYEPERYMLGILLDGDSYRQTKNTRDREISQVDVLKGLGWTLRRVWTIDWWDNRERELSKLICLLESLKIESEERYNKRLEEQKKQIEVREEAEAERLKNEIAKQTEELLAEIEEEQKEEPMPVDYPKATVSNKSTTDLNNEQQSKTVSDVGQTNETISVNGEEKKGREIVIEEYKKTSASALKGDLNKFSSPGFKAMISVRIKMVLSNEAPILKEVLSKRVLESFGVSRTNENIEAYEKAYMAAKVKSTSMKNQVICWNKEQDPESYNVVRINSDRTCEDICVQELSNALCYVISTNGPLDSDGLIKKASLLLGYQHLGKNAETTLRYALDWANSEGLLTEDGLVYKLTV